MAEQMPWLLYYSMYYRKCGAPSALFTELSLGIVALIQWTFSGPVEPTPGKCYQTSMIPGWSICKLCSSTVSADFELLLTMLSMDQPMPLTVLISSMNK